MDSLSVFLEEVHKKIVSSNYDDVYQTEIFKAVFDMITYISDEMLQFDNLFKVSKISLVGSFSDGTKLGRPNEFDFVLEMENINEKNIFTVLDECDNPGSVHVLVSRVTFPSNYLACQKKNSFLSDDVCYLTPVSIREQFWRVFTAAATLTSVKKHRIESECGFLSVVDEVPQHLDMLTSGPNIEVEMVWTPKLPTKEKVAISVDVTPAINVLHGIPFSVGVDGQYCQDILKKLSRTPRDILLIPTVNNECKFGKPGSDVDNILCWRLSFSTIETQMISEMDETHKTCLRLLKYIKTNSKDAVEEMKELGLNLTADEFSSVIIRLRHHHGDMNLLTTYMLKMAVLNHDVACKSHVKQLGPCMLDILTFVKHCLENKFLPNFFIKNKNSWSRLSRKSDKPTDLLKPHIENMIEFFKQIMNSSDHFSFETCFTRFEEIKTNLLQSDAC